jgi:hypothetical protein
VIEKAAEADTLAVKIEKESVVSWVLRQGCENGTVALLRPRGIK